MQAPYSFSCPLRILLVAVLPLAAGACNGNSQQEPEPPTTTSGETIYSASVERIIINYDGGLGGPGLVGIDCVPFSGSWTLIVASRQFTYQSCDDMVSVSTFRATRGSRTLSPNEWRATTPLLAKLKVSPTPPEHCVWDTPAATLTVTAAGVDQTYGDASNCDSLPHGPNVDKPEMDALVAQLAKLKTAAQ
jgi:hypothetical protein